jgi:circadian clock protein KaiC
MKLDHLPPPAAMRKAPSGIAGLVRLVTLDAQKAELEERLKAAQTELIAKQLEKTLLVRTTASREAVILHGSERMRELRGGDAPRKHK